MGIELFTLNKPLNDCTCPVTKTFPMTTSKEKPHHFAPISHARIPIHEIPWLHAFELCSTPIQPYKMPFRAILMFHHVLLMNLEAMLHKIKIMFTVIWNIEMIFTKYWCLFIIGVKIRFMTKKNVYYYTNLIWVLMHALYFILDPKRIVFSKVHHWHNVVFWKRLQTGLELFVFPSSYKIMLDKNVIVSISNNPTSHLK